MDNDAKKVTPPTPQAATEPPREAKAKAEGKPLLVGGKPTGYFQLGDRGVERREKMTCASNVPRSEHECTAYKGSKNACTRDQECAEHAFGYCTRRPMTTSCTCEYGCTADSECGAGKICVCADPVGYCAESLCDSDGLCDSGTCAASALAEDIDRLGPFSCRQ